LEFRKLSQLMRMGGLLGKRSQRIAKPLQNRRERLVGRWWFRQRGRRNRRRLWNGAPAGSPPRHNPDRDKNRYRKDELRHCPPGALRNAVEKSTRAAPVYPVSRLSGLRRRVGPVRRQQWVPACYRPECNF